MGLEAPDFFDLYFLQVTALLHCLNLGLLDFRNYMISTDFWI